METHKSSGNIIKGILRRFFYLILPPRIIELVQVLKREKSFILKMFCMRPMIDESIYTEEYIRGLKEKKRKEFKEKIERMDIHTHTSTHDA